MISNFKSSLDVVAPESVVTEVTAPMKLHQVIPVRGLLNRQSNSITLEPALKATRIEHLLEENNRLLDRIARLERSIADELKLWDKGFKENSWPTEEAAKRHLSRLKGSLSYPGFSDLGRTRKRNNGTERP